MDLLAVSSSCTESYLCLEGEGNTVPGGIRWGEGGFMNGWTSQHIALPIVLTWSVWLLY